MEDKQALVIDLYKQHQTAQPPENIKKINHIWEAYCTRDLPDIKSPEAYAAALEYIAAGIEGKRVTQKVLAEKYQTTASKVSNYKTKISNKVSQVVLHYYHERFNELSEEREGLVNEHRQLDLRQTVLDQLRNAQTYTLFAKDQLATEHIEEAEALVDAAWEHQGMNRLDYLKKAVDIYPYPPDIFVLATEFCKTPYEKKQLYFKGMINGENMLGKEYFTKNYGHFWLEIDSRPYMRAKLGLANMLVETGEYESAILHYREMLRLNPMDNQGIRYLLLPLYLDTNMLTAAEELLEEFNEASTFMLFNKVILNYLKEGLTEKTRDYLKDAHIANPFVKEYVKKPKSLPKRIPSKYGWGDREEAIIYMKDFSFRFWRRYSDLKNALIEIE